MMLWSAFGRKCKFFNKFFISLFQNKLSLTQVLKEAHYKTQDEYEKFLEEAPENDIQEDFHVIEVVNEGKGKKKDNFFCSK